MSFALPNPPPFAVDIDSYYEQLDEAFKVQKTKAKRYVEKFNATLPSSECPNCHAAGGHCPGLPCPNCSYRHPLSWLLVRPGEWGSEVVPLNNQRRILLRFDVEDSP